MKESKQHATYEEQIKKLKSRGCIISDEKACQLVLESISYYRFTAYFLPFKQTDGAYFAGTSFEKVYSIYEFDRKLRILIFSALEVIEVYFRAKLSNFHSEKYGPLGYLDPNTFNAKHNATKFNRNIEREIENNKKVLFVKHHIENYNRQFPMWVISEIFTFGMLSYFYNDLTTADKKLLVGNQYSDMVSWLRCCTDLRNICAHYGRLYYRTFPAIPKGLGLKQNQKRRLWGAILSVKALFPSVERWNNEIYPSLVALFEEYKEDINLDHIAFPPDWEIQIRK